MKKQTEIPPMPEDYPLNEWAWQNAYKAEMTYKEQSPISKQQAIEQAKKIRENVEQTMNK